jgi:hypothetical protein
LKVGNFNIYFRREVSKDKANRYKEDNGINVLFETSAANGLNCRELFVEAARLLYEDYVNYSNSRKNSYITGYMATTENKYDSSQKVFKESKVPDDNSVKLDRSSIGHIHSSKCKC